MKPKHQELKFQKSRKKIQKLKMKVNKPQKLKLKKEKRIMTNLIKEAKIMKKNEILLKFIKSIFIFI
jgi:hypothetical protein